VNYEDIFRERGAAYQAAMRAWPDARREEFARPLARAAIRPGDVVVDVPAGGGYLREYLPAGCSWQGHEPCASFFGQASADAPLLPLPWSGEFADLAFSIAGVHHLADKDPLLREFRRVLRPGGRLVLADAHADSEVARFLDDFVGAHNSTGHAGVYLDGGFTGEIEASGLRVLSAERVRYHWWFATREDMGDFCRLLFDMRGIEADEDAAGIERHLGTSAGADGQVGMNWELYTLVAERPV